jgi:hypothetical protein
VRRALAAVLALLGLGSPSLRAEPPAQFADVEACRQYLVDHPTGPLAEAAFKCVVEAELPAAGPQGRPFRSLLPQADIY